jgi:heavy metal efflux system protein
MLRKLMEWALNNPLLVILLAIVFAVVGTMCALNVNVEAYPDPAPAIVEVYAQFPGASAEEVEREVTIPLEVTFAGMPGLKFIHSKSEFGLADLKMNWNYGPWTYETARQEVINRISTIALPLPPNVTPTISPESPTGEIFRYFLKVPKDAAGREVYTLNDIKAMQDYTMEREFRQVPRIVDLTSYGGTVRRYEIQPDPDRLRRYGVTLLQLQNAIASSNATVGGDYVNQGQIALTVRSVGLFGGGKDPVNKVLGMKNAEEAAKVLRAEEQRRIRDIRSLVIATVNNIPVRVEDVVEGGRVSPSQIGEQGVVVTHQTRLGRVGYWKEDRKREPGSAESLMDIGHDEDDRVECIVLLRKNEDTMPALKDVKKRVAEINSPDYGRRLPGVEIEPYYDRTNLLNITTETVTENLLTGVLLVVVILFMFVNNIRTALIVAINIPLALLFAFSMLYLRGKSANLLSIGAVDFGIIVDSSVIMVENIYRNLSVGNHAQLPLKDRILRFMKEIDNALLFSMLIMVCAFVPLFTMSGAEGELFRPMAQTYAFSLAGALLLAMTLTPVLCMFAFKNFKPVNENFFVRFLKSRYLWQLGICLKYRWVTVIVMSSLIIYSCTLIPRIGTEFMPELEEGNLWIRSTGPLNQSLDRNIEIAKQARNIMATYPEVEAIVTQSGRPDDGTDIEGYENTEFFVPMRAREDWPAVVEQTGWRRLLWGAKRARIKEEVVAAMNAELMRKIPGVTWNFSQNIRDNVMEALSGFKGDNSLKIFGPEIEQLELTAAKVKNIMQEVPGMEDVGVIHEMGQSHLEMRVDPAKCERWGVMTADVNNVVTSALGARALSSMVEGEKVFDISVRWPKRLRNNETAILDIPVDIINNQVVLPQGSSFGVNSAGHALPPASTVGTKADTSNPISSTPRLRLRDLVSPVAEDGAPDLNGQYERAGAAAIFREQGKRLIAIKFSVRGRDLGSTIDEANARIKDLIKPPYRLEWAGEVEQMKDANGRLLWMIPLSLGLVLILLYCAFRSFLDAIVVFTNVFDVAVGGIWALYLTGTTFSVSAAVGFISLFGIAIMEGLLMISYFNALRAEGLALNEAIMQGAAKRVRPVMITALTAILGLLPAALSTKIGSQTARPLALVVVGSMTLTLFVNRYLMPVLYTFYGNRTPPEGAANLAH